MSQRLLISEKSLVNPNTDGFFDCIYTEESTLKNLLDEWCNYDYRTGSWVGPLKIVVRSDCLMDQFVEDFKGLGKLIKELKSLDGVWMVWDRDGNRIHVSAKQHEFQSSIMKRICEVIERRAKTGED